MDFSSLWSTITYYATRLENVLQLFDQHALTLGKLRISAYTVIKAAILIAIVLWIAKVISYYFKRLLRNLIRNRSNRELAAKIIDSFLYFVVFMISLQILGIDFATLAIFSGALGIGIGFGLQKITSNFISGLILLTEKSIEVDDLIELKDDISGWVRGLGARYTLVETFDGREVMVPNEEFITNRVINWTYSNTKGRIRVDIGVSYKSDIDLAKKLILESAVEHPKTLEDPQPECFLIGYGDSSVNFVLFFWIKNVSTDRFQPKNDILYSIWNKFKDNNIEIPFPQRDVHVKSIPTPPETKS